VLAHINLPGDGGGDQRGAAFVQQVDGALRFGGEGVEFGEFGFEKLNNLQLLLDWRKWESVSSEFFRREMFNRCFVPSSNKDPVIGRADSSG
jgi:hypothetical protein